MNTIIIDIFLFEGFNESDDTNRRKKTMSDDLFILIYKNGLIFFSYYSF